MAGFLLPSPGVPREETCQTAQMAGASLTEGGSFLEQHHII